MKTRTFLLLLPLAALACGFPSTPSAKLKQAYVDYQQLQSQFAAQIEKQIGERGRACSREALLATRTRIEKIEAEKRLQLDRLLGSIEKLPPSGESRMLRMGMLSAAGRLAEAAALCDAIVSAHPSLAVRAKWEKTKILNRLDRIAEALALFQQIEKEVPPDVDLYDTYLFWALNAQSESDRKRYAEKFLETENLPASLQLFRSRVSLQEARRRVRAGDMAGARSLLSKSSAAEHQYLWQLRLKSEIRQLGLLHRAAPPLAAENWLNAAGAFTGDRRINAKAILFWAMWEERSEQELLFLKELDEKFAARGLQVLACTRLYGMAAGNPAPLPMTEESRLIQTLLARLGIAYPVLISPEGAEFESYQAGILPTLVLIDRAGLIADILVPGDSHKEVSDTISLLLGGQ